MTELKKKKGGGGGETEVEEKISERKKVYDSQVMRKNVTITYLT